MKTLGCILLLGAFAMAQGPPPKPEWGPWAALVGTWVAEDSKGQPGQASAGEFSFEYQLDQRILVRRNFAEYPASTDRPAIRHDDLVVMYPGNGSALRATYWDNEGHLIEYATEILDNGNVLRWVSAPSPQAPRFRFTYRRLSEKRLAIRFEMAPPGKPDEFATYVEATVRKKE